MSLWGWGDWQRPRIWKGDQQAWRADELLLLGNSSCWFYIMLIFKNLHEITGLCAETNKALLSMDQKDQGVEGKNNNDNHNLVCNTLCFWCFSLTCHYNKLYRLIIIVIYFHYQAPIICHDNNSVAIFSFALYNERFLFAVKKKKQPCPLHSTLIWF